MRVLVGVGGNLGADEAIVARFRRATAALCKHLPVQVHDNGSCAVRWSHVYESEPVGPVVDQPRFINAVLELILDERWTPVRILARLLDVERALGRTRTSTLSQGPRSIDLDLLFVDDHVIDTDGPPRLQLPHPQIDSRGFVLRPLADLMHANWFMPGFERTLAECMATAAVSAQFVHRRKDLHCEDD